MGALGQEGGQSGHHVETEAGRLILSTGEMLLEETLRGTEIRRDQPSTSRKCKFLMLISFISIGGCGLSIFGLFSWTVILLA